MREKNLESPNQSKRRFSADISFVGDKRYKNIIEDWYVIENEFYCKVFLIKDTLEKYNWKLGDSTKRIGKYTCYNAAKLVKKKVRSYENNGIT